MAVILPTMTELLESYKMIREIFAPYQFQLQQFCTNSVKTQKAIDHELNSETPVKVKFFGMTWDMDTDTLSPYQMELDIGANVEFHTTRYCWGLRGASILRGIVQRQTFGTLYSF